MIADISGLLASLDAPALLDGSPLCAQTDPEVFFPDKGGSTQAAKRVCAACPVRAACLQHALAHREQHGVWGGLSTNQRRHLLARRGNTATTDDDTGEAA